jgi:hypothetical protein
VLFELLYLVVFARADLPHESLPLFYVFLSLRHFLHEVKCLETFIANLLRRSNGPAVTDHPERFQMSLQVYTEGRLHYFRRSGKEDELCAHDLRFMHEFVKSQGLSSRTSELNGQHMLYRGRVACCELLRTIMTFHTSTAINSLLNKQLYVETLRTHLCFETTVTITNLQPTYGLHAADCMETNAIVFMRFLSPIMHRSWTMPP